MMFMGPREVMLMGPLRRAAPLRTQSCASKSRVPKGGGLIYDAFISYSHGADGRLAPARDFDWRVTDALPRSLAGAFRAEPLWLDLSWARSSEQVSTSDPRFHQGV